MAKLPRCHDGMKCARDDRFMRARIVLGNTEAGRGAHAPVRCRMGTALGKESSPAKLAPAQPVRFPEKHTHMQASAKQLLDRERPLLPTPGVHPPSGVLYHAVIVS